MKYISLSLLLCLSVYLNSVSLSHATMAEAANAKLSPRSAQASIVVPYSPSTVWTEISDPAALTEEAPHVRHVRVLSKRGKSEDVEYQLSFLGLPAYQYVLHYEPQGSYTMRFNRVSGSFRDIHGTWQLIPLANGQKTKITYTVSLDPGFAAPSFLLSKLVRSDLPALMKHVRSELDKNAAVGIK